MVNVNFKCKFQKAVKDRDVFVLTLWD